MQCAKSRQQMRFEDRIDGEPVGMAPFNAVLRLPLLGEDPEVGKGAGALAPSACIGVRYDRAKLHGVLAAGECLGVFKTSVGDLMLHSCERFFHTRSIRGCISERGLLSTALPLEMEVEIQAPGLRARAHLTHEIGRASCRERG